jgi:cell division protein FtsB
VQPKVEDEKIGSLKKVISRLQEDLVTQRLVAETLSEENQKLKSEVKKLKTSQSGLEIKVERLTSLFETTFADLTDESIQAIAKAAKDRKKTNK